MVSNSTHAAGQGLLRSGGMCCFSAPHASRKLCHMYSLSLTACSHACAQSVMYGSTMVQVHWLRVILDEGHMLGASLAITNKLQMACALRAERCASSLYLSSSASHVQSVGSHGLWRCDCVVVCHMLRTSMQGWGALPSGPSASRVSNAAHSQFCQMWTNLFTKCT